MNADQTPTDEAQFIVAADPGTQEYEIYDVSPVSRFLPVVGIFARLGRRLYEDLRVPSELMGIRPDELPPSPPAAEHDPTRF